MPETVAHLAARRLLGHAVARGVPPRVVIRWLGVPAATLESEGRLPGPKLMNAWATLQDELADASLGARAAQDWRLGDLGLLGFCVGSAPTIHDAIDTAVRYSGLITDRGRWTLRRHDENVHAVRARPGPLTRGRAISNEMMVSAFVRCLRELAGVTPKRVEFEHRPSWRARS